MDVVNNRERLHEWYGKWLAFMDALEGTLLLTLLIDMELLWRVPAHRADLGHMGQEMAMADASSIG